MSNQIVNVPLEKIVHNRFQQEGVKDEEKMLEIVSSLKQNENNGTKGLLQVPTAREIEGGVYELAFGHHRFYAFDYLKNTKGDLFFSEMPLIVRDLSDIEMFELMAIENFHRRDIGPMEEASTLHAYMITFDKTSVEAAQKFEKTEEYVRGAIRLLNLPEPAQQLVREGKLNKSQARDLLVVGKLGGAELVQEVLDEIETDPEDANPSETIESVLRGSSNTQFLDKNAGWFSANKKFPVKHLAALTRDYLAGMLHFDESWSVGIPINVIKEIMTLIASGMEVTDEAFPMILPDDLTRLRVLVNPPKCEACPFHAVLNGDHYCGLPLCKERKVKAWEKKLLDDQVEKLGVPLYQKSDGPFIQLDHYNAADKKLWNDRGADLRLIPATYMWNNFEDVGQNLKVVLIGKVAEKRLQAQEKGKEKIDEATTSRERQNQIANMQQEFAWRFGWEVASRAFESVLDGVTSYSFLLHNYTLCIDKYADFPEGIDDDALVEAAQKAKKADGLKELRRLTVYQALDQKYERGEFDYKDIFKSKKPVVKYATDLQKIADLWSVKLPKDWLKQAEQYQAELDTAIKEIGKES